MGGWIKIFSKFLQWEWFDHAEMVQLFIYLLLSANYKDSIFRGIAVKKGQLLTSRCKICKDTRLTERQIRTCISRLKTTGEIDVKTTNKYTIITICKYDEYQFDYKSARPTERPAKRPTNDQQTTGKTTSNIIEDKNIRQEKKKDNTKVLSKKESYTPENFDDVRDYFLEKSSTMYEAEKFFDYFSSNGWKVGGRTAMKDWKAAARNWIKKSKEYDNSRTNRASICTDREQRERDFADTAIRVTERFMRGEG